MRRKADKAKGDVIKLDKRRRIEDGASLEENSRIDELELLAYGTKVASVKKVSVAGDARWFWQDFCKDRFGGPGAFDTVQDASTTLAL